MDYLTRLLRKNGSVNPGDKTIVEAFVDDSSTCGSKSETESPASSTPSRLDTTTDDYESADEGPSSPSREIDVSVLASQLEILNLGTPAKPVTAPSGLLFPYSPLAEEVSILSSPEHGDTSFEKTVIVSPISQDGSPRTVSSPEFVKGNNENSAGKPITKAAVLPITSLDISSGSSYNSPFGEQYQTVVCNSNVSPGVSSGHVEERHLESAESTKNENGKAEDSPHENESKAEDPSVLETTLNSVNSPKNVIFSDAVDVKSPLSDWTAAGSESESSPLADTLDGEEYMESTTPTPVHVSQIEPKSHSIEPCKKNILLGSEHEGQNGVQDGADIEAGSQGITVPDSSSNGQNENSVEVDCGDVVHTESPEGSSTAGEALQDDTRNSMDVSSPPKDLNVKSEVCSEMKEIVFDVGNIAVEDSCSVVLNDSAVITDQSNVVDPESKVSHSIPGTMPNIDSDLHNSSTVPHLTEQPSQILPTAASSEVLDTTIVVSDSQVHSSSINQEVESMDTSGQALAENLESSLETGEVRSEDATLASPSNSFNEKSDISSEMKAEMVADAENVAIVDSCTVIPTDVAVPPDQIKLGDPDSILLQSTPDTMSTVESNVQNGSTSSNLSEPSQILPSTASIDAVELVIAVPKSHTNSSNIDLEVESMDTSDTSQVLTENVKSTTGDVCQEEIENSIDLGVKSDVSSEIKYEVAAEEGSNNVDDSCATSPSEATVQLSVQSLVVDAKSTPDTLTAPETKVQNGFVATNLAEESSEIKSTASIQSSVIDAEPEVSQFSSDTLPASEAEVQNGFVAPHLTEESSEIKSTAPIQSSVIDAEPKVSQSIPDTLLASEADVQNGFVAPNLAEESSEIKSTAPIQSSVIDAEPKVSQFISDTLPASEAEVQNGFVAPNLAEESSEIKSTSPIQSSVINVEPKVSQTIPNTLAASEAEVVSVFVAPSLAEEPSQIKSTAPIPDATLTVESDVQNSSTVLVEQLSPIKLSIAIPETVPTSELDALSVSTALNLTEKSSQILHSTAFNEGAAVPDNHSTSSDGNMKRMDCGVGQVPNEKSESMSLPAGELRLEEIQVSKDIKVSIPMNDLNVESFISKVDQSKIAESNFSQSIPDKMLTVEFNVNGLNAPNLVEQPSQISPSTASREDVANLQVQKMETEDASFAVEVNFGKRISMGESFVITSKDSKSPKLENDSGASGFTKIDVSSLSAPVHSVPCEDLKSESMNFFTSPNSLPDENSSDDRSEAMSQSYKDLSKILATCSKQEQELGGHNFDFSCIQAEAARIAIDITKSCTKPPARSNLQPMMQSSFPSAETNNSEAGPVTADEDFNKEEFFHADLDLACLERAGKKTVLPSKLARQSLYVKFDPLVGELVASSEDRDSSLIAAMADNLQSSGEEGKLNTTPPSHSESDERIINITPTSVRKENLQTTGGYTPILRQEISKLQELMLQQEQAHQEKADLVEQLRSRIAELEMANSSSSSSDPRALEQKLKGKDAELKLVYEELEKSKVSNKQLVQVMEEYEKTISQLVAIKEETKAQMEKDKETIGAERDSALQHLSNMEVAFNDIHQKYERAKTVIETLHANEKELKKSYDAVVGALEAKDTAYQKLKQHAAEKLSAANAEIEKIHKEYSGEMAKMKAVAKKNELKCKSLEESLEQKKNELLELTQICDELIGKVSGKSNDY